MGQSGTTMDGVVALGEGPVTINGDDRIVFATNDGTSSMKALTIDKNGTVTIAGDLNVDGDKVILDIAALMLSKKENKDHWIEIQKIILNI